MKNKTTHKEPILSIAAYRFIPATDGGKRAIYFFEKYLTRYFDIEVITTSDNKPKDEPFIINGLLGTSKFRYINLFVFFELYRKIKKEDFKLLMLEQTYFGWLGILLKWFTGVKLIVRHHNIESLRFKSLNKWWWRLLWVYEKYTCKNADLNFFITAEDEAYAKMHYKISENISAVLPYGITEETCPSQDERFTCRQKLIKQYDLREDTVIMLFAAAYNYKPNLDALMRITGVINEQLLKQKFNYTIIICGAGLPKELKELDEYKDKHIIYAGFVDDIGLYYKGADIFLNPVTDGGGIKTKLVEALALGTNTVSMKSGASGVDAQFCGGKLQIVNDSDIIEFAKAIITSANVRWIATPNNFYDAFSWSKIVEREEKRITKLVFKSKNV